jgi:hypothetical protein
MNTELIYSDATKLLELTQERRLREFPTGYSVIAYTCSRFESSGQRAKEACSSTTALSKATAQRGCCPPSIHILRS